MIIKLISFQQEITKEKTNAPAYDSQGSLRDQVSVGGFSFNENLSSFDAFGNLVTSPYPQSNAQMFGAQYGYYTDITTGLIYARARYYDPVYGVFISRDQVGRDGVDNRYEYCENNPVTGIDPSGLDRDYDNSVWANLFSVSRVKYLFSRQYVTDACKVFKGEMQTYGNFANSVWRVHTYTDLAAQFTVYAQVHGPGQALDDFGFAFIDSANPLNKTDYTKAGQSAGNFLILMAPIIKKAPSPQCCINASEALPQTDEMYRFRDVVRVD